MTLKNEVIKYFAYLFEQHSFSIVEDNEVVVVIESEAMRFRFIRDRADFFVDVASTRTPAEWLGVHEILFKLSRDGVAAEAFKPVNQPGPLSSAIKRSFVALREYVART